MSYFHQLGKLEARELLPGFRARLIHTDRLTVAHFEVLAGSILPEHQHPHEQVTNLISGRFEMTVNGQTTIAEAGTVITIPPHAVHSGRALTDCQIIDVFQPAREDYQ
jgi:quercetin dioxygenase-like cupin family protein